MTSRPAQIGFSQRIRLEWLQQVSQFVLADCEKSAIVAALQEVLKQKVSIGGDATRGNREKIITILVRVWCSGDKALDSFRRDGLALLKLLPSDLHMPVHWGMVMATYPFWGHVALQVGRLLRLQGSVASSQVQRRIREQYGERETVSRAARRVLRSFLDWGVLAESGKKGIYKPAASTPSVGRLNLTGWLIEALLHTKVEGSVSLSEVFDNPCFFPFSIKPCNGALLASEFPRITLFRHGLNEDLISFNR